MSDEDKPLDPSTIDLATLCDLSDDALLDLWRRVVVAADQLRGSEREAVKTPEFYDCGVELLLEIEARGLLYSHDERDDRVLSVARAVLLPDWDDGPDPSHTDALQDSRA